MKHLLRYFFFIILFISIEATAQRAKVFGALGGSAYYGDLIQGSPLLKQVSGAFSLGASYDISDQLRARLTFSGLGVKADDKDNANIIYKERNLNFKSFIFDINLAAEYDFLNNVDQYSFTPYVFGGPGVFFFNPTTTDRFGNKQKLREWGTEGQGLASFPDRKPYSLTQFNIGFGAGIRVDLSDELQIGTEIFIRKTFTDYIDDVSQNSYVNPATFIAEGNAFTQFLSYRGDEAPIGKGFRGENMPRGNPNEKDLFYSFQLKITYKLLNLDLGGSYTNYYGGVVGRSKMRTPKSVL